MIRIKQIIRIIRILIRKIITFVMIRIFEYIQRVRMTRTIIIRVIIMIIIIAMIMIKIAVKTIMVIIEGESQDR